MASLVGGIESIDDAYKVSENTVPPKTRTPAIYHPDNNKPRLMNDHKPSAAAASDPQPKPVQPPAAVLADAVSREKSRKDVDAELMRVLESTILCVDAADSACNAAAAAIKRLASARARERAGQP
jgi:hypothetical protein